MDAKEFFETVKKMRTAQKDYFQTRRNEDLKTAKALEKQVDAEVNRVTDYINGVDNPKLGFRE